MHGRRKTAKKHSTNIKRYSLLLVIFIAFTVYFLSREHDEKSALQPCQTVDQWTIIDDFQYTDGKQSTANAIALHENGDLYMAGVGWTERGTRWIVRRSSDKGTGKWEIVDDYVNERSLFGATPRALAIDSKGSLYVAGWESIAYPDKKGYRHHWIVRMGHQNSWETIDSYSMGEGGNALARGIAADGSGNIFVVGEAYKEFGQSSWIVRKGSPFERKDWKRVDQFRYEEKTSSALGITVDPFGNIYVIGSSNGKWLVRKSEDNGESWKLVDIFQYREDKASYPSAIASNSYGQLFIAGQGSDEKGKYHWIVRKSEDFGESWQTVDDYQYEKGQFSYANAVVADGEGRIYVGGSGRTGKYQNPWIVRVSSDGGRTWSVSDEFKYNRDNAKDNVVDDVVLAMGLDSRGNPVAAGDVYGSPSRRWIVRAYPCR